MEIKKVKLSEIKPYFNNPRDNANAIVPTMESIKRYGFVSPIIVDNAGVIIIGHTRYIASFQLGLTEVPVIYSGMDEEKAKLCRIVDNKLAEKSSYDENKLIEELRSLKVPEDMQAFFFEDVTSMLNFDSQSIFNAAPDVDANFDLDDDDSEEEGADSFVDSDSRVLSSEEAEVETGGEGQIPETARELYKPFVENGVKKMKVVCPYCNNIEVIEIK